MDKLIKNKRGVFEQIGALGIGIVGLCITLVVVFLILAGLTGNASVAADGNASAAVLTLTDAAETIPGWVSIVVIAVIGALLLGLVMLFRGRK